MTTWPDSSDLDTGSPNPLDLTEFEKKPRGESTKVSRGSLASQ